MAKLTPKTANTYGKICKLKRDNLTCRNFWIMVGSNTITFVKQKKGEKATQEITIPKKFFERFVKFYYKG